MGQQPYCNKQGFNVDTSGNHNDAWIKLRIGIAMNQENECNSCDTGFGLGQKTKPTSQNAGT